MTAENSGPEPRESAEAQRIGPYRLLEVLGEGGMGVVWLADQSEPVKRRVALKIIKLGMDTKEVVARFESERQALAVMDHPNIARVFDAGATDTGRPYFVMEWVHGIPVDDYCDNNKLNTEARIRLFLKICEAVQHAHQKGVIHRDLKPSNILVTVQDDQPVPKVIDFGIAKAMGRDLSDHTVVTTMGQIVGTPEYMSPEQADSSGMDVDTRTDVYSLGVTLYELLVGARPFDFHAKADFALGIKIREAAVLKPSTRISRLDATQDVLAKYRGTTAEGLKKELKGDLDWIVLTAMEKDRTRRYQTVNALSMELKRYLDDVPIVARPPSVAYRAGKFIRRNRGPVIAATIAFVGAVGGAVAASVGFVRARAAEAVAQEEAATAQRVSDFLVGLFEISDPGQAQGDTITARTLLEQGANRIRTELRDEPLVQARLLATIGRVYQTLGVYDRSGSLLEDALAIRERELPGGGLEVAETQYLLGHTRRREGNHDLAMQSYRAALAGAEGVPDTQRLVAGIKSSIGVTHLAQGQYEDAERWLREALSARQDLDDESAVAQTLNDLGAVYLRSGNMDSASHYLSRSLAIRERILGDGHPDLAAGYLNLGVSHWFREDYPAAEQAYERARVIYERSLPPGHDRIARVYNNLGETSWIQGNLDEAESRFRHALELKQAVLTPDHPDLTSTQVGLANVYRDQGRFPEAE
ncbi:MAG: serine/threonine-protein kinase, partial [Gemmatimonadota bacterium]|nr:serine/threonine-protein kinase [Gemmatimonadota bacterium]